MEFLQGKIPEEKVVGGDVVFPKTLNPPSDGGSDAWRASQLVEMIKENRECLVDDVLPRHSAILFRGFGVSSPEEFWRVVQAFGWMQIPYVGLIDRKKVVDGVHTANEAPIDQFIGFHHEMSKLEEDGFIFRFKTATQTETTKAIIAKTWQSFLGTDDKVEAQRRAIEKLGCSSVEFDEDGCATIIYGPLSPIKEFGERKVWFHPLVNPSARETDVSFGDGSPIRGTSLDFYRKVLDNDRVDIKWQKGDVLLVDNLCVQHARKAGKAPRKILVSICK